MIDKKGVQLFSLYLSDLCNFDCSYCDREYIKDINKKDLMDGKPIIRITKQVDNFANRSNIDSYIDKAIIGLNEFINVKTISFHGGEPLLFAPVIDYILEKLLAYSKESNREFNFFITTNGSLINDNMELFKKYKEVLSVTLSYDFFDQTKHRGFKLTYNDFFMTVTKLNQLGIKIKFQAVIENNKHIRKPEVIDNIIKTLNIGSINSINIIPLRHHRGKYKFETFLGKELLKNFIPLVERLYNEGITYFIDGYSDGLINKDYLGNHNKVIMNLSGDLYTEYDFLEYKLTDFRIGIVDTKLELTETKDEETLIHSDCVNCKERRVCGLKYLYKLYRFSPEKPVCQAFYAGMSKLIEYGGLLKERPTFFNWVMPQKVNHLESFIKNDCLRSLGDELVLSLLEKYYCAANCEICYIKDILEKNKKLQTVNELPDYTQIFDLYSKVTMVDDLFLLKKSYPEYYEWYKRNSPYIYVSSMTDNQIFRMIPLILNDFTHGWKGIYEISISYSWYNKVNKEKLFSLLDQLSAKYRIELIKIINEKGVQCKMTDLFRWASYKNIRVNYQPDFFTETIIGNNKEKYINYGIVDKTPVYRLGETDYIQYDSFYLTIPDTANKLNSYNTLENFDIYTHIYLHLKAKLDKYREYSYLIGLDKHLKTYFKEIVSSFKVNENYTFIPISVLPMSHRYYLKLVDIGWHETELGLLKPNYTEIISLIENK